MKDTRMATVLVVLAVLLAGCSGGGTTDSAGEPSTEMETTEAPESDSGDSMASSSELSLSQADAQLRDAGSFT